MTSHQGRKERCEAPGTEDRTPRTEESVGAERKAEEAPAPWSSPDVMRAQQGTGVPGGPSLDSRDLVRKDPGAPKTCDIIWSVLLRLPSSYQDWDTGVNWDNWDHWRPGHPGRELTWMGMVPCGGAEQLPGVGLGSLSRCRCNKPCMFTVHCCSHHGLGELG